MKELLNELKISLERTDIDQKVLVPILYHYPVIDLNMIENLRYNQDPDEVFQKEYDKFQEFLTGKKVKKENKAQEEFKVFKKKEVEKNLNFKYFKERLKELKQNINEENKEEILKREKAFHAFKQYFKQGEIKKRFEEREDWNKVEKLIHEITNMKMEEFLKEMNVEKVKTLKVNKNKAIDKLKKFPMNWYQKYIYENLKYYTNTESEFSTHETHVYDWKQGIEMKEDSSEFISKIEARFQEQNDFHDLEWNHEWNENQKLFQYANFLLYGRINEWNNEWIEYEGKKKKTKINPRHWNSVAMCWELLKNKIEKRLDHQKELETFEFYLNLLMNQKPKKVPIETKQVKWNYKIENELSLQNKIIIQMMIKKILKYVYLFRKDPLKFLDKKRKELKENMKQFVIKNIFNISNSLKTLIFLIKLKLNDVQDLKNIQSIIIQALKDQNLSNSTSTEFKVPYLLMNYPNLKERIQKYCNTNRIKKEDIQSFIQFELSEIEKQILSN